MKKIISRRNLLNISIKTGATIFAASIFSPFLSGCRKNSSDKKNMDHALDEKESVIDFFCLTEEKLTTQELSIRNSLKYVDKTPMPARRCDNCKLYTVATKGSSCGGCKVVPGPIHPKGYCTAWLHRM